MAYIVMAYIVMAYLVVVCIVMAYIVMANICNDHITRANRQTYYKLRNLDRRLAAAVRIVVFVVFVVAVVGWCCLSFLLLSLLQLPWFVAASGLFVIGIFRLFESRRWSKV